MYFNSKIIVEFCAKEKLNVNEFFILYLHFKGKTDKTQFALLYKYLQEVEEQSLTLTRIASLQKRGFCVDKGNYKITDGKGGYRYFPDQLEITPKFYNKLVKLLGGEAEEVWEAFPAIIKTDSMNFPGKTISLEEFEPLYNKMIKNDPQTHSKVLAALEKQKEEGNIMCGLKKWVECKYWELETTGKSISFSKDV